FGVDLRSLALLRVGLALLTCADLVDRARDLRAHYTDFGLLPRGALLSKFINELAVCVHVVTGTTVGVALMFTLQAVVALLLLVGWRTRWMAFFTWFLMYSLHLRNPVVLQGGDDLLRMLMFWGMFVPLGARWSVDAALSKPLGDGKGLGALPSPTTYFSLGTLALVGQVLILYWSTALLKTGAEWHAEGSAVYYALNYDQLATRLGIFLRSFPAILPTLTHLTLWFETLGPFLLVSPLAFGPLRTLGAILFMGMHHSFAACLVIGLFPWIDTVSMLMLLPTWLWDRANGLLPVEAQRKVSIHYDDDCEVCKKLVQIMRELLILPHVVASPAQGHPDALKAMQREASWVVRDTGGLHTAWPAFVALARVSPLLRPLSRLLARPWVTRLGGRAYYAVATRRAALAPLTARWLPWGPAPSLRQGSLAGIVCLVLFYLVANWNIASWPYVGPRTGFPIALRPLMYMLRIDQDWGMFAPYPSKEDGWYVLQGKLDDGTVVDVYRHLEEAPSWEKPEVVSDMYSNQRWSKYMMNIWLARNAD
ncbi:MAG TPA: HTTM domain-containing protein, partial [Myxococcota bacterium]|nr:HTTM domain-containing protein [Myxococcota bacterium]